jgi:hypothetical protein
MKDAGVPDDIIARAGAAVAATEPAIVESGSSEPDIVESGSSAT